jgi:hypothetical protein
MGINTLVTGVSSGELDIKRIFCNLFVISDKISVSSLSFGKKSLSNELH